MIDSFLLHNLLILYFQLEWNCASDMACIFVAIRIEILLILLFGICWTFWHCSFLQHLNTMIEFQLTIFMCSHCTRVHNAAQDCLQHEREEHVQAEVTPSIHLTKVEAPNESPSEPTVTSIAMNAVPATDENHPDQHAEHPSLPMTDIPIETDTPFTPVEQPLMVMKPEIEEDQRPVTPPTCSTREIDLSETVDSPDCRRVLPATSSPQLKVYGRKTCPKCEKLIPSVRFFMSNSQHYIFLQGRGYSRHMRTYHPDPNDPTNKIRKRRRQATEFYSKPWAIPVFAYCNSFQTNV